MTMNQVWDNYDRLESDYESDSKYKYMYMNLKQLREEQYVYKMDN